MVYFLGGEVGATGLEASASHERGGGAAVPDEDVTETAEEYEGNMNGEMD